MTPALQEVYDLLVELAEAGHICPKNDTIGARLGINKKAVEKRFRRLEADGYIKTIIAPGTTATLRIVSLPALGLKTATPRIQSLAMMGRAKTAPIPPKMEGELGDAIAWLKSQDIRPVVSMPYTDEGGPAHLYKVGREINLTAEQVIAKYREMKSWKEAA